MGIEGVKSSALSSLAKISYTQNAYDKTVSSTSNSSENNNDEPNSFQLSSSAKTLGQFESFFDENDNAKDGVKAVAEMFADKKGSDLEAVLSKFITVTEDLKSSNTSAFEQLYELVDQMKERGLDLSEWMKIFNSLDSKDLQENFIKSTSKIIGQDMDSDEIKDSFDSFLSNVNSILDDEKTDSSQKNLNLKTYFSNIIYSPNITSQNQVETAINEAITKKYGFA